MNCAILQQRVNHFLRIQNGIGMKMTERYEKMITADNGGRRTGSERRSYSYTMHIPERRHGEDRRCGDDRREMPRVSFVVDQSTG
jgi:hypothetical protein